MEKYWFIYFEAACNDFRGMKTYRAVGNGVFKGNSFLPGAVLKEIRQNIIANLAQQGVKVDHDKFFAHIVSLTPIDESGYKDFSFEPANEKNNFFMISSTFTLEARATVA